jgi:hypothetical protein
MCWWMMFYYQGAKKIRNAHLYLELFENVALVEGCMVKPFMVRQGSSERRRRAQHERLNLMLSRLKIKIL